MAMFEPKIFYRNEMMFPGRIHSWILWRDRFLGKDPDHPKFKKAFEDQHFDWRKDGYISWRNALSNIFHEPGCPYCKGERTIWDSSGYYYCMCELLNRKAGFEASPMKELVESSWAPTNIDDYKPWTNPEDSSKITTDRAATINKVRTLVKKWIDYPTSWMVLTGPTGSGKTMMLGAIMKEWSHLALYIEAAHFEDLVFSGLRDNNLDTRMSFIRNVPMLVFDDLGIQYSSQIVAVKLDQLLQFRAKEENYQDTITVVATNFPSIELTRRMGIDGVARGASRFLDGNTLIVSFNSPAKAEPGEPPKLDYRFHRRKENNNGL